MIGHLRGTIIDKQPPWLTLDVAGIGYEVEASMNTFYQLAEAKDANDQSVSLWVHMVVREDAQLLYGFVTQSERHLFRALLKISGVGPKVALAILSTLSAAEFAACVQHDDVAALVRVPGVGKKTAERLIIEMRDRLSELGHSEAVTTAAGSGMGEQPISALQDAVSALVALGYRANDANRAVRAVPDADTQSSEVLIRSALKALSG